MAEIEYVKIEELKNIEGKYMELVKDIKEIKDDLKTIMDVLVPKLNPKQGMVARVDQIEVDLRQLQVDLIQRRQSLKVTAIIWSIVSSSLVTAVVMTLIGLAFRKHGI